MGNNNPKRFLERCFSGEEMVRLFADQQFHREFEIAFSQDDVDQLVLNGFRLLAESTL